MVVEVLVVLVEALVEVVALVEEGKHSLAAEVLVEALVEVGKFSLVVEAGQYSNSMSSFLNLDTLLLLMELLL